MFDKEIAEDVMSIVQGLEHRNNREVKLYKAGKITAIELIKFVASEYYDYKVEQLKQSIMSREQLLGMAKMLKEKA